MQKLQLSTKQGMTERKENVVGAKKLRRRGHLRSSKKTSYAIASTLLFFPLFVECNRLE